MAYYDGFDAVSVCNACLALGKELEDDMIIHCAETALERTKHTRQRLHIAFISNHMQGLDAALREAAGLAALPETLPLLEVRRPCHLTYTTTTGSAGQEDWILLTQNGMDPVTIRCERKSELLEKVDITLFFSESFQEFNWKNELAEIDYLFFVTSALHFMTSQERTFTESIQEIFGGARMSITAFGVEMLLNPDSFRELEERLNWYVGKLGHGTSGFLMGCEALAAFIDESVLQRSDDLQKISQYQTAKNCCNDTAARVKELSGQINQDTAVLEETLASLTARSDKMRRRGELAANDVYGSITGSICHRGQKAVRDYCSQICDNICNGLVPPADLKNSAENIPSFINFALNKFGDKLQKNIQDDMTALQKRLEVQMRKDAGEFFTDIPDWTLETIHFTAASAFDEMKGGSKSTTERIANALLVSTVPALFISGLPFALGTLVASQAVRKISTKGTETENREQLIQQVNTTCQNISSELQAHLQTVLHESAGHAEEGIRLAYDGFVQQVLAELTRVTEQLRSVSARQAQIRLAETEHLPAVMTLLPPEESV